MKNRLTTNYVLTIREDYVSLIPLVAAMNGWNGDGDPKEFLSGVTNDIVKGVMRNMIEQALNRYYGLSQSGLISQAMVHYDESVTLESSWSEVE